MTFMPYPQDATERQNAAVEAGNARRTPSIHPAFQAQMNKRVGASIADPNQPPPQQQRPQHLPDPTSLPPDVARIIQQQAATEKKQTMAPVADSSLYVPETPVADGEGISLALPSKFRYYGFKDLFIKPFLVPHLAKLSRAHQQKNPRLVVETISAIIYTSDPAYAGVPLAFHLTLPDYYFILYYQRLNNFGSQKLVHTDFCQNKKHQELVKSGEKEFETLKISEVVDKSQLVNKELDGFPQVDGLQALPEGCYAYPPTLMTTLEYAEHPNLKDPEWRFVADIASNIRLIDDEYANLETRMNFVNQKFSPDAIQAITTYADVVAYYGITETISIHCKECGHQQTSQIVLDAHSFLPS